MSRSSESMDEAEDGGVNGFSDGRDCNIGFDILDCTKW